VYTFLPRLSVVHVTVTSRFLLWHGGLKRMHSGADGVELSYA
jgi:hypothetical protein